MASEGEPFVVSTDPARLDVDFVCAALAGSYWAQSRPRAAVEESIRNSLCFGLYEVSSARQVGFARIVTDGATFSWLCDVIIDKSRRGEGLGKMLVAHVCAHPVVAATTCLLATRDAHGLYERHGFTRCDTMRRGPQAAG